jgi:hypothetical protein
MKMSETTLRDEIIREESWQFDIDGMISTMICQVYTGERVPVSKEIVDELGLTGGTEGVDPFREKFNEWHDYDKVAKALADKGGHHVE